MWIKRTTDNNEAVCMSTTPMQTTDLGPMGDQRKNWQLLHNDVDGCWEFLTKNS